MRGFAGGYIIIMAYIYRITNLINGKAYVGLTKNLNKRIKEHLYDAEKGKQCAIHRALRKYGMENFSIDVIEETNSPEEREIYWIKKLNTFRPNGYNMTIGGEGAKGYRHTRIARQKLSTISNRYWSDPKWREKQSEIMSNAMKGRQITWKDKLSEAHINSEKHRRQPVVAYQYGEMAGEFKSLEDAWRWLQKEGYTKAKSKYGGSKICRAIRNERPAYGFMWERVTE